MNWIVHSRRASIFIASAMILVVLFVAWKVLFPADPTYTTTTVEKGNVSEIVAVSGVVEAPQIAALGFSSSGIVTGVLVKRGDTVVQGEVLASLAASQLLAERAQAVAGVQQARASLAEVAAGPRDETVTLSNATIANAEQNLTRTTSEQAAKVAAARSVLLSSQLQAVAKNSNETATPPTVTGTYTCSQEGVYTLEVYRSGTPSGYSYRMSGIESDTLPVTVDQPAPLGSCGVFLQFSPTSAKYTGSVWTIAIPNKQSSVYAANKNAYALALESQSNAVAAANDALTLARDQGSLTTASARNEGVAVVTAQVAAAQARVAALDVAIADRSIVAPFSGTVTEVSIVPGENAPTTPVITLLPNDAFELKAKIPEIDITSVAVGQRVDVRFDAASSELLGAKVGYVSPVATEIDGVAYFETIIALDTAPYWIRAGLNADVNIITNEATDTLRVPLRFVDNSASSPSVLVLIDGTYATTTVTLGIIGNGGYVEIIGLNEGTILVAP